MELERDTAKLLVQFNATAAITTTTNEDSQVVFVVVVAVAVVTTTMGQQQLTKFMPAGTIKRVASLCPTHNHSALKIENECRQTT